MLVTTSFTKAAEYPGDAYSVCATTPVGTNYKTVSYLLPPLDAMKMFKEGQINADQFAERYQVTLEAAKESLINLKRLIDEKGKDIVLVCHCPHDTFCHRILIVKYLVKELGLNPELVDTH
jgi:hypothetical protein